MADSRSDDMGTAAAAERELTLTPAQALALAIERYRLDELDDAEMIYAALLERWTDRPDVLNYMGVLQHQRGENGAALALLRHAVEVAPDTALAPWRPGRLHRRSLARGRRRQPSLAPPAATLTRAPTFDPCSTAPASFSSGSTPTCCARKADFPCPAGSSARAGSKDAQAESACISAKRSALPSKPMPGSSGSVTMLSFTATPSGKPP